MLKESKWLQIGNTVFELRSKENIYLATLSYNGYDKCWFVESKDYFEWVEAEDIDSVKDAAFNSIMDHYNQKKTNK